MSDGVTSLDRQVRDWLLGLLCFAVTREDVDRLAIMTIAERIDAGGSRGRAPSAFTFFRRTSVELCNALCDDSTPRRSKILRVHLARISDLRLRRALATAAGIEPAALTGRNDKKHHRRRDPREGLWKGLGA